MVITRPPGQGCHLQQQWNKFHHWTKDRGHHHHEDCPSPHPDTSVDTAYTAGAPRPPPHPTLPPGPPQRPTYRLVATARRRSENHAKTAAGYRAGYSGYTGLATLLRRCYQEPDPELLLELCFRRPVCGIHHQLPTSPHLSPPRPRPPQLNFQSKLSTSRRNWGYNGPGIVLLCVSALVTPNSLH